MILWYSEVKQIFIRSCSEFSSVILVNRKIPAYISNTKWEFPGDLPCKTKTEWEARKQWRKKQKTVHAEALCEMMEVLTGDARFTALTAELLKRQEKGEEIIMCEYIDMLEAKGKEIGENRLASLLAKLYSQGRDEEAKSAVADRAVRARLYEELCIG